MLAADVEDGPMTVWVTGAATELRVSMASDHTPVAAVLDTPVIL